MNRRLTPSSACAWLGVVVALTLTGSVRPASAAEIRMLGAGPLRAALVALAEQFQRETGHVVKIETLPGAEVTRILASDEPADIFMSNNLATVDRLITDGKAADSKTLVGRTGIGVMVRSGAPVPIVATAADIKAAVLAADAVAYNTAPSGQYVEKLFEQMGVAEKIKDKSVRPPNGATTMERVAGGKGAEIGFGLRNEMTPYLDKGLQFVAMLPDDLQNYTRYEAVVLSRSKAADAARAFLRISPRRRRVRNSRRLAWWISAGDGSRSRRWPRRSRRRGTVPRSAESRHRTLRFRQPREVVESPGRCRQLVSAHTRRRRGPERARQTIRTPNRGKASFVRLGIDRPEVDQRVDGQRRIVPVNAAELHTGRAGHILRSLAIANQVTRSRNRQQQSLTCPNTGWRAEGVREVDTSYENDRLL